MVYKKQILCGAFLGKMKVYINDQGLMTKMGARAQNYNASLKLRPTLVKVTKFRHDIVPLKSITVFTKIYRCVE